MQCPIHGSRDGRSLAHITSKKSSPSLCTILPWRQRLRNHLSFMKSRRKFCLNCCDSCTSKFFSWLQNFCSSRLCRLRLCSSNSRRSSAFWWSSFSWGETGRLQDRGRQQ